MPAWLEVGLDSLSNTHESSPEMYVSTSDFLKAEEQLIQGIYPFFFFLIYCFPLVSTYSLTSMSISEGIAIL